jgi:hypothetical protein
MCTTTEDGTASALAGANGGDDRSSILDIVGAIVVLIVLLKLLGLY